MSTCRRARLAVLGVGRMGARHARNVARSPVLELVGVADGEAARARALASELGCDAVAGIDELLTLEPDGLVVATPPMTHAAAIEQAAAAGVHLFCEKPLALDLGTAARAVAAAERGGVRLQLGFQMRFDRDLQRLAQLLASGALGRPFQLHARLRDVAAPSREYLAGSGGYFHDGAVHCFDLARWLLGEVTEVTAVGAALSSPLFEEVGDVDNAIVVLRFASGALGTIDVSRVAGYGFDSAVELLGELGTARVAGAAADGLELCRDGQVGRAHVQDFIARFEAAYPRELEAFGRSLLDPSIALPVTGADGLAAMAIAEAATVSHRRGRSVRVTEIG